MQSRVKKTRSRRNESIEPKEAKQKKPYNPPRFAVLTPDQAKLQLTERALPGEPATAQLLAAACAETARNK
jgi:hypothetical protein